MPSYFAFELQENFDKNEDQNAKGILKIFTNKRERTEWVARRFNREIYGRHEIQDLFPEFSKPEFLKMVATLI